MNNHATICCEQKQTLNFLEHNQNKQTVYDKDLILSLEKFDGERSLTRKPGAKTQFDLRYVFILY